MKPRKVKLPSQFSIEESVALFHSLEKIYAPYRKLEYMADRFGVSKRTINDWRAGKSKPPDTTIIMILYHILLQKDTPKNVRDAILEFDASLFLPVSASSNFEPFLKSINRQ